MVREPSPFDPFPLILWQNQELRLASIDSQKKESVKHSKSPFNNLVAFLLSMCKFDRLHSMAFYSRKNKN
ncbi:hypothetical protein V6Z11_A13G227200 [Gossypium hirsutum]